MRMLQAEPPSAAEVAHDPRLERVIGAILSGAGEPSSPPPPTAPHLKYMINCLLASVVFP